MAATPAQLRADFPEFADPAKYPDTLILFWLGVYEKLMQPAVLLWDQLYDTGKELATCHQLVMEAQAIKSAAFGAPPGVNTGPQSQKAIDKVSESFDTQASIELDAGHWNLTKYGTRFIRLARMFGAGATQVY